MRLGDVNVCFTRTARAASFFSLLTGTFGSRFRAAVSALLSPSLMTPSRSLIDEIEDALSLQPAGKRDEALARITDLFVAGADHYTEDHVGLFDDVISRLAATIEADARAKLAQRLAPLANAPVKVSRALAADADIAVAEPLLRQSERLNDRDLLGAANKHGQQHLLAIAQRRSLSETVTEVLVVRGDREVVRSVAANQGARFSNAGFRALVARSSGDEELALHVGARHDLPRQHLLKLIEAASASVRQKLAAADPATAGTVREVIAEIDIGLRAATRRASADYASARAEVEALHRAGQLDEARVCAFADMGKFEETAVALSLLTAAPIDVTERAMLDDNPDMAVILAKVAGFSWSTAHCILVRAAGRGRSAADLDRAFSGFSRLKETTACSIVAFHDARRRAGESLPVKAAS
jgi:uncharacterized protein (DUF2336 family)